MPDIIKINGKEIKKGENLAVNIHVAKLPTHTPLDIPVYIYRGKKDGPVLLLCSTIHGDEINGIEIIRRLTVDNRLIPIRGTVITLPLINVYGFLNKSRPLPDGRDLNRSFPGSSKGSLAGIIAYMLMNEIIPNIDYCVDFHTGGAGRANFPQLRCSFDEGSNELELAKAFSPPFIVNSPFIEKSFRKEVKKKGKTLLVFESGESLRFDEYSIQEGYNGVLRLMNHLKMHKHKTKKKNDSIIINNKYWVRARNSGLFIPCVRNGQMIKKKQLLGKITDPFGESEHHILAKSDGYIIALNHTPMVNKGDATIHIGST